MNFNQLIFPRHIHTAVGLLAHGCSIKQGEDLPETLCFRMALGCARATLRRETRGTSQDDTAVVERPGDILDTMNQNIQDTVHDKFPPVMPWGMTVMAPNSG